MGSTTWFSTSQEHPIIATITGICFALLSFVFHIFGCFFALLIGSSELIAIMQRGFGSVAAWRFAKIRALSLAVALLPPSILYFASPLAGARGCSTCSCRCSAIRSRSASSSLWHCCSACCFGQHAAICERRQWRG